MNELERSRIVILFVLFYLTILITFFIHGGDDTHWHIRVGEWIGNHLEVPRTGLFSQTKENAEWIAHEWLSEVIIYLAFDKLGWPGLVLLAVICITISILIALKYLLELLTPIRALCLILLSYGLLLGHIMPRPHIFVLPIMTYWFVQMLKASEQNKSPSFYTLPLQVLWANIHGSFLISIPYALFFAVESVVTAPSEIDRAELIKKWAIFIALSIVCLFITPYGIEGVWLPLQLTSQKYALSFVQEWNPPNFQHFEFFELWLFIVICFAFTQKFRLPVLRLAFLLGLIHLSLKHGRYANDLLSIQGSLLLASPLAKHWQAPPGKVENKLQLSDLIPVTGKGRLLIISTLFGLMVYVFGFKDAEYPTDKKTIAMLKTLRQFGPLGNVFNSYELSGFLIFEGYKPFIDSRAELYQDNFLKSFNEAITLLGGERKLDHLLNLYKPDWTFLTPQISANAYFNMHPDWVPVFANKYASIHVRRGRWTEETILNVRSALQKQFGSKKDRL